VEQSHDLTNRNQIRGLPSRTSKHVIAKSITIKGRGGKSGRCVAKAVELTSGGLKAFLSGKLKLKVNEAKSAVARPHTRKFLGFTFSDRVQVKRRIAPKALARFKDRIRELTQRTRRVSVDQLMGTLKRYMTGWRGYFGFCETPSVLRKLDEWVPSFDVILSIQNPCPARESRFELTLLIALGTR
jgi:hypothetical protein